MRTESVRRARLRHRQHPGLSFFVHDCDNINGRVTLPVMDQNAIAVHERLTEGRRIACGLLKDRGCRIHGRILPKAAEQRKLRPRPRQRRGNGQPRELRLPPLSATAAPNGPFCVLYRRSGRRGGARRLGREQGLSLGSVLTLFCPVRHTFVIRSDGSLAIPRGSSGSGSGSGRYPLRRSARGAGRGYRGNLSVA